MFTEWLYMYLWSGCWMNKTDISFSWAYIPVESGGRWPGSKYEVFYWGCEIVVMSLLAFLPAWTLELSLLVALANWLVVNFLCTFSELVLMAFCCLKNFCSPQLPPKKISSHSLKRLARAEVGRTVIKSFSNSHFFIVWSNFTRGWGPFAQDLSNWTGHESNPCIKGSQHYSSPVGILISKSYRFRRVHRSSEHQN